MLKAVLPIAVGPTIEIRYLGFELIVVVFYCSSKLILNQILTI